MPVFIKITFASSLCCWQRSCAELGREPSFGHLSFLQRVFTILCCLRHYATFCWTQDTKKESVSFWILSLLTYWNPSSNPFSPWAPGFPTEPCVHHRPFSPASAPLAPASFVAQEPLVPSPVSAADNQRLYSQTLGFEVWCFLPAAPPSWAFRLSEPSFALLWNEFLAVLARWIKGSNVEVDIEASGTSWSSDVHKYSIWFKAVILARDVAQVAVCCR